MMGGDENVIFSKYYVVKVIETIFFNTLYLLGNVHCFVVNESPSKMCLTFICTDTKSIIVIIECYWFNYFMLSKYYLSLIYNTFL